MELFVINHELVKELRNKQEFKLALGMFNYLKNNQLENGAIFDPFVSKQPWRQYAHTFFGLSGVILYFYFNECSYIESAERAFEFYLSMEKDKRIKTTDFHNWAILMAYLFLIENTKEEEFEKLKAMLLLEIKTMTHTVTMSSGQGNNFIALRSITHLLRYRVLKQDADLEESFDLMKNYVLKWQFNDGIFYDFPRQINDKEGIPSLTYHAKIVAMVLLFSILTNDGETKKAGFKGLDILGKLITTQGEAFFYGRSNNALYGYVNAIFAYALALCMLEDNNDVFHQYCVWKERLLGFITNQTCSDGHLHIIPNKMEESRAGYDSYMYVSVYNAHGAAILLLINLLNQWDRKKIYSCNILTTEKSIYLKDSGFFIFKSDGICTCLNLKGHTLLKKYFMDPRFSSLTLLFLEYQGKDLLPTIPFTDNERIQLGRKPAAIVNYFKDNYCYKHYYRNHNPRLSGFVPFLQTKNAEYVLGESENIEIRESGEYTTIVVQGKFVELNVRGMKPLLNCFIELWNENLPFQVSSPQRLLYENSSINFERRIIIHPSFIHFVDRICSDDDKMIIPLTIRVSGNAQNYIKDMNFFSVLPSKYGFCIPLKHEIDVSSVGKMLSSKGAVDYYKVVPVNIKSKLLQEYEYTIIPFEDVNNFTPEKREMVGRYIVEIEKLS
ncbi:MAG: hypothetical protein QME49_02690 [bacterium]|nr:hypothetical protein [bacterium]